MNCLPQPKAGWPADSFTGISNALLILQADADPVGSFRVMEANLAARQLAGPISLLGASIQELPYPFYSPELVSQLNQLNDQNSTTPFQLQQPGYLAGGSQRYECQLVKAAPGLLVFSLLSQKPPPESPSLEQVIEALPAGLIVFRAIRRADGQIVDFQAALCNPLGATITGQPLEFILSRPISERYPTMQAYDLLHRYVDVVTTGQPHQQLLYLPPEERWFSSIWVTTIQLTRCGLVLSPLPKQMGRMIWK